MLRFGRKEPVPLDRRTGQSRESPTATNFYQVLTDCVFNGDRYTTRMPGFTIPLVEMGNHLNPPEAFFKQLTQDEYEEKLILMGKLPPKAPEPVAAPKKKKS